MTPSMTTNSLPDFETIFHQIIGQTMSDINSPYGEEWLPADLVQADNNQHLLLEALQTSQSRHYNQRESQLWDSLKRKLSQTV